MNIKDAKEQIKNAITAYFTKDANLMKTAGSVASINTGVAVLSGFVIFPAVFSVPGLSVDAGPGLLFVTLPNVFHLAFAGMPWLGYIFSLMFYVLLVLATLTSTISLHEVATAYLSERFKLGRTRAAWIVTGVCTALGVGCALSFGLLSGIRLWGMTLFSFSDFLTAKLMLPLGGMFISIFTGWWLDRRVVWEEVTNHGSLKIPFFKFYVFLLKYVAPISIAAIFIHELF